MIRASDSNSAFWKARTSSGSSRSDSAVKPVRSAKRTVTCRRSASGPAGAAEAGLASTSADAAADADGAAGTGGTGEGGDARVAGALEDAVVAGPGVPAGVGAARALPQRGQKAKEGSHASPHAGQGAGRRCPQRGQNANPGEASRPQPAQVIRSQSSPAPA